MESAGVQHLRDHGRPGARLSSSSRTPSTQSKPGSSSGPKSRGSASGRPHSAGISAWEDDEYKPGADRKGDPLSSGSTTPGVSSSGYVAGDGSIAQALLAARAAAEMQRRSSGASGMADGTESPAGASRGGSGTDMAAAGAGERDVRRGPGRLSRSSGCEEPAAAQPGDDDGDTDPAAGSAQPGLGVAGDSDPSGILTSSGGEEEVDGEEAAAEESAGPTVEVESTETSWPAPPAEPAAAGGHAAGAASSGRDLRTLLYSDDEADDDDEDDYQDLMTADDEALFGGVAKSAPGSGRAKPQRGGSGEVQVVDDGDDEGVGLGHLKEEEEISTRLQPVGGSGRSTPGEDGRPAGEEVGGGGGASRHSSFAPAHGTGGLAPDAEPSVAPRALSLSVAGLDGPSGNPDTTRTAWASDGGALSEPPSSAPSPQPPMGSPPGSGLVGLPSHGGMLSPGQLEALQDPGADDAPVGVSGPQRASTGPGALGRSSEGPPRMAQTQWPQQQQQQHQQHHSQYSVPQHHHSHPQAALHGSSQPAHHSSIPTALVGEGLRQHPPMSRRTYTPGQNNRSPVRGSGYVVSPAAVRPTSPPQSPGRPSHHVFPAYSGAPRRQSYTSQAAMAITAAALTRPRSPRDSHASALSAGGHFAPHDPSDSHPPESTGVHVINFGFTTGSLQSHQQHHPQQHHQSHGGGSALGQAAGAGGSGGGGGVFRGGSGSGAGFGPPGPFGRFPPAAVQHFAGGQVYRSMPISQLAGSASDEVPGAGAAGPGAAGGGAAGVAAGTRGSHSPGRLSGRGGRQLRPPALGPTASAAFLGHMRDRYGSNSAPARPVTSPMRGGAGAAGATRSPKRNTHTGPLSPASATAVFGNGVTLDTSDLPATAPAGAVYASAQPRALAVPSLPVYVAPAGIRHCGFKPGAGPPGGGVGPQATTASAGAATAAGGGQMYGSSFQGTRQRANDERMRSVMLAKVMASVAAKEAQQQYQQFFAGVAAHDLTMLNSLPPQQQQQQQLIAGDGGGATVPPFDSSTGGHLPGNLEGWAAAAAAAAAAANSSSAAAAELQVQRRGSLPHLLAASYQAESSPGGHGPSHLRPSGVPSPGPGVALLGPYGHAGRSVTPYDGTLPAVQHGQMVGAGVRSMSFDVARRATPRA